MPVQDEPHDYSIEDLEKEGTAEWDGECCVPLRHVVQSTVHLCGPEQVKTTGSNNAKPLPPSQVSEIIRPATSCRRCTVATRSSTISMLYCIHGSLQKCRLQTRRQCERCCHHSSCRCCSIGLAQRIPALWVWPKCAKIRTQITPAGMRKPRALTRRAHQKTRAGSWWTSRQVAAVMIACCLARQWLPTSCQSSSWSACDHAVQTEV